MKHPVKVLHLSTYDIEGGAARGANWLHQALRRRGVDSAMLVMHRKSDDPTIRGPAGLVERLAYLFREGIEQLPLFLYPKRDPFIFSPAWFPSSIDEKVRRINPDIVHLHWVCGGFVTPEVIAKFKKPVVWTLRDMWGFTGGCHYSQNCDRYLLSCGRCPHLNSGKENDLSHRVWTRKFNAWKGFDFSVVAISRWLGDCARESSLFKGKKIHVIHNAVDETVFRPIPKEPAREVLALPQEKKIILFGSMKPQTEKLKGLHCLAQALRHLSSLGFRERAELVVIGSARPDLFPDFGLPSRYLGRLNDDGSLACAYSAADVTVVPSVQEAFGKMAIESMACGTPVVSFDSTGLKDIVEHQKTGYRAKCFDPLDLATGIAWVLEEEARWHALSERSRKKVEEEFTLNIHAEAYLSLYREILNKKDD